MFTRLTRPALVATLSCAALIGGIDPSRGCPAC